MDAAEGQFVDQEVTQKKFEEELESFLSLKDAYRKIGVLLLEQNYPNLFFAFAAPSLTPTPIAFAVRINFTNYDVQPLSVKFVHPLTFEPVVIEQVLTHFPRRLEGSPDPQKLLQAEHDRVPFFCIPGVREYHDHPFHNGDSWFLYRKKSGEGSLLFLLDNLQLYGTGSLTSFCIPLNQEFNLNTPTLKLGYSPGSLPL